MPTEKHEVGKITLNRVYSHQQQQQQQHYVAEPHKNRNEQNQKIIPVPNCFHCLARSVIARPPLLATNRTLKHPSWHPQIR